MSKETFLKAAQSKKLVHADTAERARHSETYDIVGKLESLGVKFDKATYDLSKKTAAGEKNKTNQVKTAEFLSQNTGRDAA